MSILLKALEKSEQARKAKEKEAAAETEASEASSQVTQAAKAVTGTGAVAAGPAAKAGGFKLGDAAKKSSKAAGRVVAAYESTGEEEEETGDDNIELVKASRRARRRRIGTVFVLAIVATGGFFVYEEFGKQFIESQIGGGPTTPIAEDFAQVQSTDDATLLPLPEPIYDIQESILIASLSAEEVENVDLTQLTQERELADRVTQVVSSIIEDQLEEERQRELLASIEGAADFEEDVEVDEVEKILTEEFDIENANQISVDDFMQERLDEIAVPFVARGKREYVIPTGFDLAQVDEEGNLIAQATPTPTVDEEESPAPDPAPAQTQEENTDLKIVRNDSNLKEELDNGIRHYQLGNLNDAERSFRTIIAAEPENVSALLGLAKIHQSRGNNKLAVATLLKASDLDPTNSDVVSELLSIQSETVESSVSESKLLQLLGNASNARDEAKIFFILGNVYARSSDWLQAKRAFVGAHQLNTDNPDYAYNLAVIHDYLAEETKAIQMYQHALDRARAHPSSFDQVSARSRLETLTR